MKKIKSRSRSRTALRTLLPLLLLIAVLNFSREIWAFSGFQRSLNNTPWGLSQVTQPVQRGRISERFELRPGDCGSQPGWSDCAEDRERVEQSQRKPYIPLGQTVWVSWSIMLDPTWQDISPVTTTLGQFHHRESSKPALLFVQRNNRYALRIESAGKLYQGRDHHTLATLDHMRGRWTRVVVQVRFSSAHDGILRVWVNDQQVLDLMGPNTLGTTPVFFKYGIYRSFVSRRDSRPTAVAYWDEVRSGPTRSHVDPGFNPALPPQN